jgi:methionine salvage enolase-phosphatase E1
LFPYAKDEVERYLTEKWEDAETIKDVTALRELVRCYIYMACSFPLIYNKKP